MHHEAKSHPVFLPHWSRAVLQGGPETTQDPLLTQLKVPAFTVQSNLSLRPHILFLQYKFNLQHKQTQSTVLISLSVPSSSIWNAFYIKAKKKHSKKNILFEEKKKTAKDMNATVASFNELVVAGGVLLLGKVEEKVFSLIRSLIFFAAWWLHLFCARGELKAYK